MARLSVQGAELVVGLSWLEKVGGLVARVRVPLHAVREVRVTDHPYDELRGFRVGTGVPWVIVLGRMVHQTGTDFVAVYGTGRTVVVDLDGKQRFRRILVSGVADRDVATVQRAVAAQGGARR